MNESGFNRVASRLPRWSLVPIAVLLLLAGIAAIVWAIQPHVPVPHTPATTPDLRP